MGQAGIPPGWQTPSMGERPPGEHPEKPIEAPKGQPQPTEARRGTTEAAGKVGTDGPVAKVILQLKNVHFTPRKTPKLAEKARNLKWQVGLATSLFPPRLPRPRAVT